MCLCMLFCTFFGERNQNKSLTKPFPQGILSQGDPHSTGKAEVSLTSLKTAYLNGAWPNFPDDRGIENWECYFSQMLHGTGIGK